MTESSLTGSFSRISGPCVTVASKNRLSPGLRAFEGREAMPEIMGPELCRAYARLRGQKWESYMHHFSEWERQNALDI